MSAIAIFRDAKACIGYIIPEYFKFPGEVSPSLGLKFADVPNGLGALSKVPPEAC